MLKIFITFLLKGCKNPNILFRIKQCEPLLIELFTEQDDSIYIKPVYYLEYEDAIKHLRIFQDSKAAIKITNYSDKGIYLLFNDNFYISYIFYKLTNKGLEVVKTTTYNNIYNSEKLLNCFLFYIYEGTL